MEPCRAGLWRVAAYGSPAHAHGSWTGGSRLLGLQCQAPVDSHALLGPKGATSSKSRAFLEMRMPSLMSCSGVTHTASQRFSILRVGPRRLGTLRGRMNMTRPGGYMLMSRCRRSTLR